MTDRHNSLHASTYHLHKVLLGSAPDLIMRKCTCVKFYTTVYNVTHNKVAQKTEYVGPSPVLARMTDTNPSLEASVARRRKNANVRHAVLATLAGAGMLSVAVIAPNALKMLGPITRRMVRYRESNVRRAFGRLCETGCVEVVATPNGTVARLTDKGRAELARTTPVSTSRPRRWDGKWRVVIFDIKEAKRRTRDRLREILKVQGFKELQHSVWVYPYPCEELHVLLKSELRVGKEVLYMVVEELENDGALREHFKLSKS